MAGLPIPANAEHILFAEDLISYIMLGFDSSYRYPRIAEPYRRYVYNAFTDVIRYSIVFLCRKLNRSNFLKFEVLRHSCMKEDISGYFRALVGELYVWAFSKGGFEPKKFLFFCAQVSSMAGVFYLFGTREAPKMAVEEILWSFDFYTMEEGAWDTLSVVAEEISKLNYHRDCLFDVEDIVKEFKKCDSPRCLTPEELFGDEGWEEGNLLFVDVNLREIDGIDEAWRDRMVKKYSVHTVTLSDDSSSDSSEDV